MSKATFDVDGLLTQLGGRRAVYDAARELDIPIDFNVVYNWNRGVNLSQDRMRELEAIAAHVGVTIEWGSVLGAR